MKPNGKSRAAALLALTLLALTSGCGGINASKSVSPLDFILPGLMQVPPPPARQPVPAPLPETGTKMILLAQAN